MRLDNIAFIAAATLALTSPVAAQQSPRSSGHMNPADMAAMHCGGGMGMMHGAAAGQHPMPGMGADSMHRMMRQMMGPPSPAMILSFRTQLALSSDQVSRLEALQKDAGPACVEHMRLAMTAHLAANQLLEAPTPDFAAYTAKLKEAAGHMVEGHVVMAKAAVAARGVLTAAQRQTLQERLAQGHGQRPR